MSDFVLDLLDWLLGWTDHDHGSIATGVERW